MKNDKFGRMVVTTNDICDLIYRDPGLDLSKFLVEDPEKFNSSLRYFQDESQRLTLYTSLSCDVDSFDEKNQNNWHMPDKYQSMDIAKWVLDQCHTQEELQRVGKELLLFQDRDLMPLLQYLKFLVDTLRKHNIVWGVGRGSSVSSYVLYLIGVHKINSIKYELDIEEFLK